MVHSFHLTLWGSTGTSVHSLGCLVRDRRKSVHRFSLMWLFNNIIQHYQVSAWNGMVMTSVHIPHSSLVASYTFSTPTFHISLDYLMSSSMLQGICALHCALLRQGKRKLLPRIRALYHKPRKPITLSYAHTASHRATCKTVILYSDNTILGNQRQLTIEEKSVSVCRRRIRTIHLLNSHQ